MAICTYCAEDYPDARLERAGFEYCISCSPLVTSGPAVFMQECSKSNPTFTTRSDAVCVLPGRSGASDPKSSGWIRLTSTKGESRSNYKPPIKPH